MSGLFFVAFILYLMKFLLANNVDPDQMPHYVASDLGLHCLPMTHLRVSGKKRLKALLLSFQ